MAEPFPQSSSDGDSVAERLYITRNHAIEDGSFDYANEIQAEIDAADPAKSQGCHAVGEIDDNA
jgi:hypothetical protein